MRSYVHHNAVLDAKGFSSFGEMDREERETEVWVIMRGNDALSAGHKSNADFQPGIDQGNGNNTCQVST